MNKEEFIKMVMNLSDEGFEDLKDGINFVTFEKGWDCEEENFKELIHKLWKEN